MPSSVESIRKKLAILNEEPQIAIRQWKGLDVSSLREAAVLIPLIRNHNSYSILLTKRSEALRQHSGEVSFPGGRRDPEDPSLEYTALRESEEEVGLLSHDVKVFGRFSVMPTISNYYLSAYVGEVEGPYLFTANPGEIETLIEVPIDQLIDPLFYSREDSEWNGQVFPMHRFEVDDHVVWGATGYILFEFLRFLNLK